MNFRQEWLQALSRTKSLLCFLLGAVVLAYPLTGVISIKPDEAGVLMRFGKVTGDKLQPGMHFTFPWPVDKVLRVPVRQVRTISLSLFYPSDKDKAKVAADEPHLLTGDKNLIQINLTARFSIASPRDYLFSCIAPEKATHDIVASAVVSTAAAVPVDSLLTIGRLQLQEEIKLRAQKQLDALSLGILLRGIEIKDVNPPRVVLPDFKAVVNAQMQRNTKRHKAESRCSSLLARAKSLARKQLELAKGERTTMVSKARGETERFKSLLKEYRANPGPTRRRIYLETMQELLPRFRQIIAVSGEKEKSAARIRIAVPE